MQKQMLYLGCEIKNDIDNASTNLLVVVYIDCNIF